MKRLFYKFLNFLRDLFSQPTEIVTELVKEDVEECAHTDCIPYEVLDQDIILKDVAMRKSHIATHSDEKNYLDYSFDDYIHPYDEEDDLPKEITTTVTEVVNINNITKTLKVDQDGKIVKYKRTPRRTPKYDLRVGDTTFYAWNKGEVYTTKLEGKDIQVISNPTNDYTLIGFGEIY